MLVKKGFVNNGEDALPIAAPMEDLFCILREGHVATWHGREFMLYKRLCRRYFNISLEMCMKFVNDCATCIKMRVNTNKARSGHIPILTIGFGSRGQVNIVVLQSAEFDGLKWRLTYCDHGTKFAATSSYPNKQVHCPLSLVHAFPLKSILSNFIFVSLDRNYCEGLARSFPSNCTTGYCATR